MEQNQLSTLPATQQAAWLGMAAAKNQLVENLAAKELQAQSVLINADKTNHEAIGKSLLEFKKIYSETVELRKQFTSQIDAGIIQPLMAYEKRIDPKTNADFAVLESTSLMLRKAAEIEANKANLVNAEIAVFKAFLINEWNRVVTEYRTEYRRQTLLLYTQYLQKGITPEITAIFKHLEAIQQPPFQKFAPVHLTYEQMQAIFTETPRPSFEPIKAECEAFCKDTFANFESDLANKEAAIKAAELQEAETKAAEQKKLAEKQAITTLISTAEVAVIDAPKIKRELKVDIIESELWAKTIMAAFITNLPSLVPYIRVKSWAKLSIGQMAEYLGKLATETGETLPNLTYLEIEK